jgi:nitroreductase
VAAVPDPLGPLEAMATTRAIRRYLPEPIADADLASIMWHATRAPSGSNSQPFRFVMLRDGPVAREAKVLLREAFRAAWASKASADGYDDSGATDLTSRRARMAASMQHFVDHVESIPVVVIACHGRDRTPHLTDGASVYPACQNLLLAARTLGYGGVMTMWHRPAEEALRELLDIPPEVLIAATITLGRPAGHHGPVRRRPLGELVYEERWGDPASWAVDPPGTRFTRSGSRPPS